MEQLLDKYEAGIKSAILLTALLLFAYTFVNRNARFSAPSEKYEYHFSK